jgi:hypothetical protein
VITVKVLKFIWRVFLAGCASFIFWLAMSFMAAMSLGNEAPERVDTFFLWWQMFCLLPSAFIFLVVAVG